MMRNIDLASRPFRTSCSILAVATVLVVGATPASAQSFLGSGTATNGAATTITTGVNTTNISVTAPQTVIDWVPFDNAIANNTTIAFQNSGTTASFAGSGNFAVLNRINPADSTRSITMNGTIQTTALGFAGASNGSLYFYTPGGFVIGSNAVINVGSLVLSASPITVNGSGNFITGANNQVIFGQATRPGAAIITNSTSQINATAGDAYVAMVAPRVQHGGTINVNGSAALVGAEAATINFSPSGLFDIQVTVGTTDSQGVSTNGNITGSASTGPTDARRAFLVAVPKNTALTMAISSGADLGFDVAGAANVVGNAVILSAGRDIVGGEIGGVSSAAGAVANLTVNALNATSGVRGAATGFAEIFSNAGQSSSFASDLTVTAPGHAWVNANGAGAVMNIARDLVIVSDKTGSTPGASATGGDARLYAQNGGSISIGRNSALSASGYGAASAISATNAGGGTGGLVHVSAINGGSLSITGNLIASADGFGGDAQAAGVNAGKGTGGTSLVRSFGGNTLLAIGGTTLVTANGTGGAGNGGECFSCNGNGGYGQGGQAEIYAVSATNSTTTLGAIDIRAGGIGGSAGAGTGGYGNGGDAELFYGGGTSITVNGNANLEARGFGGVSGVGFGGNGDGGYVNFGSEYLGTAGGSLTVNGNVSLNVQGFGGATTAAGATGGSGIGGTVDGDVYTGTETVTGSLVGGTTGFGGAAVNGIGGSGYGGRGWVDALGGSVTLGSYEMYANGRAGSGRSGGYGEGGHTYLLSESTLHILNGVVVQSSGFGGLGTSGNGGNALGGTADVRATGGTLTIDGAAFVRAAGAGGESDATSFSSGNGTGGSAYFRALNGGTLSLNAPLIMNTNGFGGDIGGNGVNAGNGKGGYVYLEANGANASVSLLYDATLNANGFGGSPADCECSVTVDKGGNGTGGEIYVRTLNGTGTSLNFDGNLSLNANGIGSAGSLGAGGNGVGGYASVQIGGGGLLTVDGNVNINAWANGGDQLNGGTAGNGSGGTAFILSAGDTLSIGGTATVVADGTGGNAATGTGGSGLGGTASVESRKSLTITGTTNVSATGSGGTGGSGGAGTGGSAKLYTSLGSGASLTLGGVTASAKGFGGNGNANLGGVGQGGDVQLYYAGATTLTVNGAVSMNADGRGGGSISGAADGTGGDVTFGAAVGAAPGGSLLVTGNVSMLARGFGGDTNAIGAFGGVGRGGTIASGGGAGTINITGQLFGSVLGFGGYSGRGTGGSGYGGDIRLDAFGATITVGSVDLEANGAGGDDSSRGGDAQGGYAALLSSSSLVVQGDALVRATAVGGFGNSGDGGDALGGEAYVGATDGTLSIGGNALVRAQGFGGGAGGSGETAGDGHGGNAQIITRLGTITIGNNASVYADGFGGDTPGGTGGFGFGGPSAGILAINGNLNIGGFASVSGSGFGGNGMTGGSGFGSDFGAEFQTLGDGAQIFARNGNIVINGGASVAATGAGGNGGNNGGNGGNGSGGLARILAQNGDAGPSTIRIVSGGQEGSGIATVYLDGTGGNGGNGASGSAGGNGGNGGTGNGGYGGIFAAAGNGTVTIDNAYGYSRGTGGSGGNGGNGDGGAGGNGGKGGKGVGGSINIGTISGGNDQALGFNNGVGNYGTITADASAWGGIGGNGNFGATNGNGGNGGKAIGGNALLLVRGSIVNVGTATLTANAHGGAAGFLGGIGGFTGIGGDATVGGTDRGIGVVVTDRYLIPAQRGTLKAGTISGTAVANSGIGIPNGQSKSLGGSGVFFRNADGTIGSLDFVIGVGWNGSTSGVDSISVIDGNVAVKNGFRFVTPGNLSLFANNGNMHAGILTLNAGNFVFDPVNDPPTNRGTYFANGATITTGNDFVTSANLDIGSGLTIDAPGLIDAQKFTINGDLALHAQSGGITATILDVTGRADLFAAGSIQLSSASAGYFDADAGGSFTSGDITSDTNIRIHSDTDMTLGDLIAGLNVDFDTSRAVRLDAHGSILMGDVTAKDGIGFSADGSVTGGNLTSGFSVQGNARGAIHLGAISAGLIDPQGFPADERGFSVGIGSKTSINVGNVAGAYSVGFLSLGPITTGTINAGADFLVMARGNMLFGPITAAGRVYLADSSMFFVAGGSVGNDEDNFDPNLVFNATPVASGGSITINGPVSAGSLQAAAGTFFMSGNIDPPSLISITAGTSIGTGSIDNAGDTSLHAGTSINVGAIHSGTGAVSLIADTSYISGSTIAAGSIHASSGSDIFLGNLTANGDIELIAASNILVGNALAGEGIDFNASGYVDGGNMTAGDTVAIKAGRSIDLGNVSAGLVNRSTAEGADYNVGLRAGTTIHTGTISAARHIRLAAKGNINTGNINATLGFLGLGGGDMSFGSIHAGQITYLANYSMYALGGSGSFDTGFNAAAIISQRPVASGGSITIGGPVTTGTLYAAAGTSFDPVNITSNHNIYIDAGTDITLGNLVAGLSDGTIDSKSIRLTAGGSINVGNAIAPGRIKFKARGTINGGNITSGDMVNAEADGAIVLGNISSGLVNHQTPTPGDVSVGISSKTSIHVGDIDSAGTVGMVTLGALNAGHVNARGDLIALAGGNMTLGDLDIGGRALLSNPSLFIAAQDVNGDVNADDILNAAIAPSGGSITTGTVNAGSLQASAGTTLNVGTINSNGLVNLLSGGTMQAQAITAGSSLRLTSGGTINGGNLTAGTLARLSATGAVNVGNITGGTGIGPAALGPGAPVEVFGASIVTGNIATAGYVGLYTPGNLTVGTINAGHDVIALAGTDAGFGTIATPERFFLGGYSMFAGLNGGETFNPALVFGATKAKTGGSATFGGSSSANSFQAYVGTDTTLQSLDTSSFALVDTGGTFALNGTLNGNSRIISNDIAIGGSAAVNTGNLHLVSRNATQTVVGDGVVGGGYQLSDAEFDRIHTPLSVVADTTYGAAAKMLIGDLSAAVSGNSQSGYDYEFATVNGDSSTSVGSIRVVGNVVFNGLSLTDEVVFRTNLFELDAATGSVSLYGQGTTLGGILGLYTRNILVASGAILTKLEADPRYSGYIAELNAPAAVQRPGGVLNAAMFDIDAGEENFQNFLVQNTGTKETPAGFLVNDQGLGDKGGGGDPPGSINLVINGQIITPQATLTGVAVRDLLVANLGTDRFVAGSTINGCPLVGSCNAPPPKVDTVTSSNLQLVDNGGLGDGLFGNEADIAGGESGDGGDLSSPISPPIPLFDSRPLERTDDINDPASGAGNPSLYGNPDDEDQGDDDKKTKKVKKGDGK